MNAFLASVLRGVRCAVVFVVALGGVCWAIREALPFPDVETVKPKLAHFTAHHDDYDTLFIGSSRIYFQIIPALFDRLASEQGLPVRSFNAAIASLRPPEDAYYLDRLLRARPQRLRWVFIELAGLRTAVDRDKVGTVRAVYWHDWKRMWVLFKRALAVKPDTKKRKWRRTLENRIEPFGDFIDHIPLFFEYQTNIGRGSMLASYLISTAQPSPPRPRAALGEDLSGWIRTGRPEVMTGRELADYDQALADRREEKPRRDPGDPVSQEALEEMIAKIERVGATPVLIVPPTTNKRNFVPTEEREAKTIVLDFSDFEKYPELYEHRYRLDTDHLNTEGSAVFTRILVKTWLEEVERRR